MRKKITQDFIRKLTPGAVSYDVRDTAHEGLVLRVYKSGKSSWMVRLTDPDPEHARPVKAKPSSPNTPEDGPRPTLRAPRYWHTLGRGDVLTPDAAWEAAKAVMGQSSKAHLGLGLDPRAEKHQHAHDAKRTMTLHAFLEDHYREHAEAHHKSVARGAETIARITSRFPELLTVPLAEITPFALEKWRTMRLKAGTTRATINRDTACLKVALTYAVKQRFLDRHPLTAATDFRPLKTDRFGGKTRILSDDEETALRKALAARDDKRRAARDHHNVWRAERSYDLLPALGVYTDHLTPIVLLALFTGCRFGELAELRWSDLDLTRALLSVRSETAKTGTGRIIPLHSEAVTMLRAWMPTKVDRDAAVFPGKDGGRLVDIKTAWREIMKAAALTDFRFHDTRHTFASRLIAAGADINMVRELLGHATVLMTSRYLHTNPTAKASMIEKLARAVAS
jgi:integrase